MSSPSPPILSYLPRRLVTTYHSIMDVLSPATSAIRSTLDAQCPVPTCSAEDKRNPEIDNLARIMAGFRGTAPREHSEPVEAQWPTPNWSLKKIRDMLLDTERKIRLADSPDSTVPLRVTLVRLQMHKHLLELFRARQRQLRAANRPPKHGTPGIEMKRTARSFPKTRRPVTDVDA